MSKARKYLVIQTVAFILLMMASVVPAEAVDDGMVLIPAGIFEMGNPDGQSDYDNVPLHRVTIDSFYLDKYEVTVGQFRQFVNETDYHWNRWLLNAIYSPSDDHPVVYVDWNAASAYAKWMGKRLPTEAEWEYAARGGLKGRLYPWGSELSHDDANYHRTWGQDITHDYPNYMSTGRKDKWRYSSAPVGSFNPNGFGLYDMAGNVAEWCSDWYQSDYYAESPGINPQGPETGLEKVSRGGHWFSWDKGLRVYNRGSNPVDVFWWQEVQGFRLAADL